MEHGQAIRTAEENLHHAESEWIILLLPIKIAIKIFASVKVYIFSTDIHKIKIFSYALWLPFVPESNKPEDIWGEYINVFMRLT